MSDSLVGRYDRKDGPKFLPWWVMLIFAVFFLWFIWLCLYCPLPLSIPSLDNTESNLK